MTELDLLKQADSRARAYVSSVDTRPVFPGDAALQELQRFDEPFPEQGAPDEDTLRLLDEAGSPATVVSNGPNYYGFVIGAALPVAAAAERMAIAWDQCASSYINSPAAHAIEKVAARWVLDALDLPRGSAVTFGTSASACGLVCLTAARRTLLQRQGWNFDEQGLAGAPEIKVVISDAMHITVVKALRILGFGTGKLLRAPVDSCGRIVPETLPPLDEKTILCLQAGEVNTGEFDPFIPLIRAAKSAGAWVHVDGAFGLWARASAEKRDLTNGIEGADSWTTDGHKWLNTPYDGAMGICRVADDLAEAMNSDAAYSSASTDSQKNLGLEFSRRARGIPIWAAMRSLGHDGIAELIERHCRLARMLADGLRKANFEIMNRVVLNQVLFRLPTDVETSAIRELAAADGRIWFGPTVFQGRPACRMSVSSFRTNEQHIDTAIEVLTSLREQVSK